MRAVLWISGVSGLAMICGAAAVIATQACDSVSCEDLRDPNCICGPSASGATKSACDDWLADACVGDAAPAGYGALCAAWLAEAGVDGGASDAGDAGDATNDVARDVATSEADAPAGPDTSVLVEAGDADAFVCPSAAEPKDEPCVIDEAYGVFVSPSGSATGVGTRTSPLKSIDAAITLAKSEGDAGASKRVYACGGTYGEALAIDATRDGVTVYGGLDCSQAAWTYDASKKAVVSPSAQGYALSVSGLKTGATFVDTAFVAADASTPGGSSIAVFVSGSQGVSFVRAAFTAGRGANGADGATGVSNVFAGSLDGNSATTASGAASKTCVCPDQAASMGGQGGGDVDGGVVAPSAGGPMYSGGMAGTNAVACNASGGGSDGADAPVGTADTPSVVSGSLSSDGWAPAAGAAGSAGKAGQGGGGGGDGRLSTGGGGGGACGGCGGAGATPGMGGGSSIALAAVQSAIVLTNCTLTTSAAGAGGTGGSGDQGQPGGSAGAGFGAGVAAGCAGGAGGTGAGGNGAQGGAGGLSIGIGYSGTAPTLDGTVVTQASTLANVTLGTAGAGGVAGIAGPAAGSGLGQPGSAGVPGVNGVAQAIQALP